MKKHIEKTRKTYFTPDAEDWKVNRMAYLELVYRIGDILTVKAAGEVINLTLHTDKGRPLWYTSAPIERETAQKLYGVKLSDNYWSNIKTYTLYIGGDLDVSIQCADQKGEVTNYLPVKDLSLLKIVKPPKD